MVEFTRCFLARAKICRAVKIFVYVSKSAQTWPEIQPRVEYAAGIANIVL